MLIQSPLTLSLTLISLIFLGLTIYLFFNKTNLIHKLQLTELELKKIQEILSENKSYLYKKEQDLNILNNEHSLLRENFAKESSERNRLSIENSELKKKIGELLEEASDLKEAMSAAHAALDGERQRREDDARHHERSFIELQNRLKLIGQDMVSTTAQNLSHVEREQFNLAVKPLKDELEIFRSFLSQSQSEGSKQAGMLQNELLKLRETQNILSKQACDLSLALTQGGKSQGMWGELQLERVLESSGLTKGIEYEREVAGARSLGEEGRPDAVVRLPENHCLIIDAKCSLTAYTQYMNAKDEAERESAKKAHITSVKNHIQALSRKNYANYKSLNSPSFVFMFIPIDGALSLALNSNEEIYDNAASNNIYLVSPSSLIPALRVTSNLWVLSKQNERVRILSTEAQQIYNKFNYVLEALDDVLRKNQSLKLSLDTLNNRIRLGKGNLEGQLKSFSTRAPVLIEQEEKEALEKPLNFVEERNTDNFQDFRLI